MRAVIATCVSAMLFAACASPAVSRPATGSARAALLIGGAVHPSRAAAIAAGRDLGPLPGSRVLPFTLGLAPRDANSLAALVASGTTVSAGEYAARFGPDAEAVDRVRAALATAGIAGSWSAGETTLAASGRADAIERYFGTRIDSWVGRDGVRFYAPREPVAVPAALRPVVDAVTGLDDYPSVAVTANGSAIGVTPAQMEKFYDVTPLIDSGLDGAGTTIVFVEIDKFSMDSLDAFASRFGLPSYRLSVHQNAAWGAPDAEAGEADLDLELAHAIAPAAREVVYYASPQGNGSDLATQAAFDASPRGAIMSESIGACETPDEQGEASVVSNATAKAAAEGWSILVASGDRGAFGCLPDGDADTLSTNLLSSDPNVTAVGGTFAVLSSSGGYLDETAWGEPIEQWGSGGGLSIFYGRPSYQDAPGTQNSYSNGMRESPDVSANGDLESGWDVFAKGQEVAVGGTSASAPFWAALIALIDEDLQRKGLAAVGFANPALYSFARTTPGSGSRPFHDITSGTNLYYPATAGWDYATGLGTPDASALMSAFEQYRRANG